MTEEILQATRQIYEGRLLKLRLDTVLMPAGHTATREIVEHPGAVAIVALDESERLVLVSQYRRPVGRAMLELPAGTLAVGEDPEACAPRELQEETGYTARTWERICGFYPSPGFCTEYLHIFLATGLAPGPSSPEEDENIRVVHTPLFEALRLIHSGDICDSKSIIGILITACRQRGVY